MQQHTHQCLAAHKQTVVEFQSANKADWHCRYPSHANTDQNRQHHPWPGVIIDSQLSLKALVDSLCLAGFFQLQQLWPTVHSLTTDATRTLVQTFVSRHLDYCNSLLYGVSDSLIQNGSQSPQGQESSHEHTTALLTEASVLQVQEYVIVCQSLIKLAAGYQFKRHQKTFLFGS